MARVQHLEGFTEAVMGTVANWRGLGPETLAAALAVMGADTSATITADNVVVGPPVQGAIEVQAALAALDANKSAIGHVHAASVITFAPVGTITSTDVQAALSELDGDKSPVGHGHIIADVAGLQGVLDAKTTIGAVYAASAITNAPAGTITSTTVQAALNELDTKKSAVGHTHAASAIGVTPSGGITSTNVGSALAELDSKKSPVGHGHIIADVSGLQTALDAKVPVGTVYTAGAVAVSPVGTLTQTNVQSALQAMLLKAGDTMTGPIVLSGDATLPLHPVSKRQLDASLAPALLTIANGATGTVAYGTPLRQMLIADTATDDYARFLVDTGGVRQMTLDVATGIFGEFAGGAPGAGTAGKLNVYFSTAGSLALKNLTGADVTVKITPGVMPVGGYAGAASGIVLANGDTVEQEFGATKRQANLSTDLLAISTDYLGVGTNHTLNAALTSLSQAVGLNPKGPGFGAKGDGKVGFGTVGAGSTAMAMTSANVTVGMLLVVFGAGTAGAPHVTTAAAILDATHVTLTDAAITAVTSAVVRYGTKDSAALQAAIDYAIAHRMRVEVPPGRYMLDVPVHAPRGSTSIYYELEITGAGSGYDLSTAATSAALTVFDSGGIVDGPAFFCSSCRGVRFRDLGIIGPNPLAITAGSTIPLSSLQSAYVTPGVRVDRYSPNAGICIDGLRSANSTPPTGGGYPGQTYGPFTASSAVRYENVTIQQFAVGVMNTPVSYTINQQGDDVYMADSRIYYCDIAMAAGQAQTRGCSFIHGSIGGNRCCFDGVTYGQQQGQIPLLDKIVIGYNYALFNIDPGFSYVKIGTAYLEGCVTIGRAYGASSAQNTIDLGTMYWKTVLAATPPGAAIRPPLILETTAPTTFKGEMLDYSAGSIAALSQLCQNAYNIAGGGMFHFLSGVIQGRSADEVQLGWVDVAADQVRVTDLRTFGSDVSTIRRWGNPHVVPSSPAAGRFQPMRHQAEVLIPLTASSSPYFYTTGTQSFGRRAFTATNVVNPGTAVMTFDVDAANLSLLHIGADGDLMAWRVKGFIGPPGGSQQLYTVPAYKLTSVSGAGPFTVTATALFDTTFYDATYANYLVVAREWAPFVPVTIDVTNGSPNFTNLTNGTVVKPGDWVQAASGLASGTRIDTISGTTGTLKKNATATATITLFYGRLSPATLGTPLA